MTTVAVLGGIVAVLLLPLVVSALRHRSMVSMALRNLARRRGEAVLVIAGSLLGTAIITSSFVVGDIVDGSITDVARTQLGPVDVALTPADPGDLDAVMAAIDAAGIDEVEEVLPARSASAALEAPRAGDETTALPSVPVLEIDVEVARAFGGEPASTGLADLDARAVTADTMILNERTADRLEVTAGDTIRIHAYGTSAELILTEVVEELGLAGYGGAIVAPGTFERLLAGGDTAAAPPRAQALVSLEGGVFDTRELSDDAVAGLRAAVADIPGVEVDPVKASLLDAAERDGTSLTELFTAIGSFSVLAGILLLVNLFVMLAEERKTELGMLRAIGYTRRRLTRSFALEGALYASVAAALGAIVGIGVGWAVASTAGAIFGFSDQGVTFRLVVEPASIAIGGLTGLAMSLVTIWITSVRIARLNVIRAIRDLPEPKLARVRARSLVLGAIGVLAGGAVVVVAITQELTLPLVAGVPLAAFSASPLLRRLLPERLARALVAGVVLAWGIGVFQLFPGIFDAVDLEVFVVQGVVLTAGAVSLASTLDVVWVRVVDLLATRGRGLAARLGLAYPLARRFRTSMLLGMFSLVIFTMTFIAALSSVFDNEAETFATEASAGYDLLLDTNAANPVTSADLLAYDEVAGTAGLSTSWVRYATDFTTEPRPWAMSGFDEELLEGGTPTLVARDPAYDSDAAAYAAVLADPRLALVPETFLQDGPPSSERVMLGDTFEVLDPVTGEPHELRAAGIVGADWIFNGVLVSRELTGQLLGPNDVVARHYLAVADGVDPDAFARQLDVDLLPHGGNAGSFTARVDEELRQQNAFLTLLQAFLGLGLLVGIAGLGVVMVRAVRERRQEIGMLRALGFRTGLVRAAFLSEAGLIALQGIAIGSVLGLVTARQVFLNSNAFGDSISSFAVPWSGLPAIVLLPLVAALVATAWPAARAAAIRPAVALRIAD